LDRFVLPGQSDADAAEFPGGEAFNTAAALAGWGVPVILTGTAVGDDAEGTQLRELLRSHPLAQGIDISLVPFVPGAVTPVCTVRVDKNGERFMSGRGFKEVTAPELQTLLPQFADRPLVTVDPNLGSFATELARFAARSGCFVLSMDCADVPAILDVSDVAVTSHEWVARSGHGTGVEQAANRMTDNGANFAIVTQGTSGGVGRRKESKVLYQYNAVTDTSLLGAKVLDTTGAGDAFRAGLCYKFAQDHPDLSECLRFASAAAALHCTVVGGGSRFSLSAVTELACHVRVDQLPTF
jgi:sugar/nucleoside kinase (ribokinase family)